MSGTVLVTGATGYLGGRVVSHYLKNTDLEVIASGRMSPDAKAGRVRWVNLDVTDSGSMTVIDRQRRARIKHVVHAAADTRFDISRSTAQSVNVDGSCRVWDLAGACPNLEAVGYVSSFYSSGLRPVVIQEVAYDNCNFANDYEWSKHQAELDVLARASDLPARVFRPSTVIADDDTGRVGQHNAFHNTLKLWFYGLLSVVPGADDVRLHFTTADFTAKLMFDLMHRNVEGIFNI